MDEDIAPFRDIRGLDKKLHELEVRLNNSFDKKIEAAFPDGDLHAHRIGHENEIKKQEQKQKFRAGVFKSVVEGAAATTIGFALAMAWDSIKNWKIK